MNEELIKVIEKLDYLEKQNLLGEFIHNAHITLKTIHTDQLNDQQKLVHSIVFYSEILNKLGFFLSKNKPSL